MKLTMTGTESIPRDTEAVRTFIEDPAQVGQCLPDLVDLPLVEDRHLVAVVKIGVGAVRGRFKLDVAFDGDGEPGTMAMTLRGSGMGSALDMTSRIALESVSEGHTDLHWEAESSVSGPLAAVGGRLLERQAKKTTLDLFRNIRSSLESDGQSAAQ